MESRGVHQKPESQLESKHQQKSTASSHSQWQAKKAAQMQTACTPKAQDTAEQTQLHEKSKVKVKAAKSSS